MGDSQDNYVEKELKLVMTREAQAKFSAEKGKPFIRQQLQKLLDWGQFTVVSEEEQLISDTYLDTPDHDFLHQRFCCRVRSLNGTYVLTLKTERDRQPGLFDRNEGNKKLDRDTFDSLLKSNGHLELLARVRKAVPSTSGKDIVPTVRIRNERTLLKVTRDDEKYEIAIDDFRTMDEQWVSTSDQFFELEIEGGNDEAKARLSEIKKSVPELLPDLQLSEYTKYELGVRLSSAGKGRGYGSVIDWIFNPKGWIVKVLTVIALVATIVGTVNLKCNGQADRVDPSKDTEEPLTED